MILLKHIHFLLDFPYKHCYALWKHFKLGLHGYNLNIIIGDLDLIFKITMEIKLL